MKEIDFENWYRKDFYNLYTRENQIPLFHIATKIDITNAYNFAKANSVSFYFTLSHIFHTALSEIEEFNIRIKNGKLVVDDCNGVNMICLEKGEKMFKIIVVPYKKDIIEFCHDAKAELDKQKTFLSDNKDIVTLEYITCQPWLECTMTNPLDLNADDFVTRLSWDKIHTDDDGKKTVNVTIGANHRVIDGLLISKVFARVNELISSLK